jgi:hypothetical protein
MNFSTPLNRGASGRGTRAMIHKIHMNGTLSFGVGIGLALTLVNINKSHILQNVSRGRSPIGLLSYS